MPCRPCTVPDGHTEGQQRRPDQPWVLANGGGQSRSVVPLFPSQRNLNVALTMVSRHRSPRWDAHTVVVFLLIQEVAVELGHPLAQVCPFVPSLN